MKQLILMAATFSILLVLAGCALQPVSRQRPEVGEDGGPMSVDVLQTMGGALCPGFDDPLLEVWQEQALGGGNLDLAQAGARLEQALALADQRRAALWPGLNAELGASRWKNATGTAAGGSSPVSRYTGSLAASYEVDLWGRLGNEARAAILEARAAEADIKTAEITVSAELAEAWFDLIEARRNLRILAEQYRTSSRLLELVRYRFQRGMADGLDIVQQEQQLESLAGEEARARAAAETARHRLALLSGGENDEALELAGTFPEGIAAVQEDIPVSILAGRPDLTGAWLRLRATDHRTAAAVGDWLPGLNLSVNLSDQAMEISRLFDQLFWQMTATAGQTVFDGGLRSAVIRGSEARAREQLYRYAALYRQAIRELYDAMVLEKRRLEEMASLSEQYRLAGLALDLAETRYRNGEVDYLRVLTALQSRQDLALRLVALRRQRLSDRIGLCRAMGRPFTSTELYRED